MPDKSEREKKSLVLKVKELWSSYGYVALGTYFGIYLATLSSIFLCLDYDIFNAASVGLDPAEAVNKVCNLIERTTGYTSVPEYIKQYPKLGTFAVAWVMTKFTEPIRAGVTLVIVPRIAKLIGYVSVPKIPL